MPSWQRGGLNQARTDLWGASLDLRVKRPYPGVNEQPPGAMLPFSRSLCCGQCLRRRTASHHGRIFPSAQGELRPLHGINKGPLAPNGLVDVTEAQKRLRVPSTRLHDCHNPNPAVVDLHAVFPNPDADPVAARELRFPGDG